MCKFLFLYSGILFRLVGMLSSRHKNFNMFHIALFKNIISYYSRKTLRLYFYCNDIILRKDACHDNNEEWVIIVLQIT